MWKSDEHQGSPQCAYCDADGKQTCTRPIPARGLGVDHLLEGAYQVLLRDARLHHRRSRQNCIEPSAQSTQAELFEQGSEVHALEMWKSDEHPLYHGCGVHLGQGEEPAAEEGPFAVAIGVRPEKLVQRLKVPLQRGQLLEELVAARAQQRNEGTAECLVEGRDEQPHTSALLSRRGHQRRAVLGKALAEILRDHIALDHGVPVGRLDHRHLGLGV
mmetsp:Transcript_133489/g.426899  ORF Transcript_133489/g.426899 Transcript_133489/m.426899 type:complete len:216 (+) Transcript_133489:2-649(+)